MKIMSEKTKTLLTNERAFAADFIDVAKLFLPEYSFLPSNENTTADIVVKISEKSGGIENFASFEGAVFTNSFEKSPDWTPLETKRYKKRYAKIALFNCLKKVFSYVPPWGSLTGIRPTKLAYEISHNEGKDFRQVFSELFDVSPSKIGLVSEILESQKGLRVLDGAAVDFYVGIPFCTSRCSYCSFSSGVISRLACHVAPYIANLKREISESVKMLAQNGFTIRNAYVGGGTPTSLSARELDDILSVMDFPKEEFTVEAGRPDTVDEEKLSVLKAHKVGRVSINPQTFNQATLDAVGRSHTVEDIVEKFFLAKRLGFSVNMDLIAGLPGETREMFIYSADRAAELNPDNITVHTLALKKGSLMKERGERTDENVAEMVDYAREKLSEKGYRPYYLYRQKYVAQNLENVGYAKPGKECRYNIDIMEETASIAACGCNAISKRVFHRENRIERQANPKDVLTYNKDLGIYLSRKRSLFENSKKC